MAQILVRDLDAATVGRLKVLAKQHGRSLQGQVKVLLIDAVTYSRGEVRAVSERWQKRLAGRSFSDSAQLIREDRSR